MLWLPAWSHAVLCGTKGCGGLVAGLSWSLQGQPLIKSQAVILASSIQFHQEFEECWKLYSVDYDSYLINIQNLLTREFTLSYTYLFETEALTFAILDNVIFKCFWTEFLLDFNSIFVDEQCPRKHKYFKEPLCTFKSAIFQESSTNMSNVNISSFYCD